MPTQGRKAGGLRLGPEFRRTYAGAFFVGGASLAAGITISYFQDRTLSRFYFAYLINFAFFLSISLGALFFVLLQHLTRAGWSVGIRRLAEIMGCALPVVAALSAPIVVSVVTQQGALYHWAAPAGHTLEAHTTNAQVVDSASAEEHEPLSQSKRAWLSPARFVLFVGAYFLVWSFLGVWYWRKSVQQDNTGDDSITLKLQGFAPLGMIALAITLTLGSFDLLMSLDPYWYSTIFGVYFFSGCAVSIFATLILISFLLQKAGYLTKTITKEHYHDLGKFLFAFAFFWGYIAFSQFMLLWYANVPETNEWFVHRGATSVSEGINTWTYASLVLLFGHLLIPFVGMISRHVKRTRRVLVFWAIWMLAFHWFDLHWLIMPELDGKFHLGIIELLCLIGIGGIYVATLIRIALWTSLRPVADPRLADSLAFENI